MRRLFVLALLMASLAASCRHTPPVAGERTPEPKSVEVEKALVEFSAALAHGNADAVRNLAAPGFTLIDEGQVYDVESTIESIRDVLSTGSMVRVPEEFATQVRGNIAWSHYRVHGRFQGPKVPSPWPFSNRRSWNKATTDGASS